MNCATSRSKDYGNSETDDRDDGAGTMEAICERLAPLSA